MFSRRDLIVTWGLSSALAVASLLPYIVASQIVPDHLQFTNLLINPWDGFSYLAKMNQGAQGSLLFTLPYSPEPGPGAAVFVLYLLLGRLAVLLGVDLIIVMHAARLLATLAMGFACAFMIWQFVPSGWPRYASLAIALFGAGVGWVSGPLGISSSDLYIPESIPFQASLVNVHFPLATALVACAAGLIVKGGGRRRAVAGLMIGLGLGGVLPFAALPISAAAVLWLVFVWWRARAESKRAGTLINRPLLGFLAGLTPWLLYDLWLVSSHPVLQIWNAQNKTPSPPILGYLTGLLPGLVVTAILIWRRQLTDRRRAAFLLIWLLVHFALAYAPLNVQRRTMLGVALPLAAMTGLFLADETLSRRLRRLAFVAILLIGIPTNLLVSAAGVARAASGDELLTYSPEELATYAWISDHAPAGSLVLAAPISGNRLPAFAAVRVVYGHPYETIDADAAEELVTEYFRMDGDGGLEAAARLGADYVLLGRHEIGMGADPAGWANVPAVAIGDSRIYQVNPP